MPIYPDFTRRSAPAPIDELRGFAAACGLKDGCMPIWTLQAPPAARTALPKDAGLAIEKEADLRSAHLAIIIRNHFVSVTYLAHLSFLIAFSLNNITKIYLGF